MAINDGGPAFPGYTMEEDGETVQVTKLYPGMTLRDYFAAKAMQGDWASQSEEVGQFMNTAKDSLFLERALAYYRFADAMIAARLQEP